MNTLYKNFKKIAIIVTSMLIILLLILLLFKNKNFLEVTRNKTSKFEETGIIDVYVELKEKTENTYKCLVTFTAKNENETIKSIEFPINNKEQRVLNIEDKDGRKRISIDYEIAKDDEEEIFKIKTSEGNIIEKEIVRKMENIFEYIPDTYQEFEVRFSGNYRIECWGASGGRATGRYGTKHVYANGLGGKGGYVSGEIYLNKGEKFYVYVGGHGADAIAYRNSIGGYNGGGLGTWDNGDDEAAGAGGGATDLRLTSGKWDNFDSLKSRIMVAAGGAGASWNTHGGAGGGWEGLTNRNTYSFPGTQTNGYKFGIGQDGYGVGASDGVGGAGGGYYGGTTNDYADECEAGAGGSSFVSGNENCNAISIDSTENNIIHTNQPVHYSGKAFINSMTEDGNSITHQQRNNDGNGLAIITLID